jgi:hypothetical protein
MEIAMTRIRSFGALACSSLALAAGAGCSDGKGPVGENCTNLIDDDGDGRTDCDDPECVGEPRCSPEVSCADGIDNEGDGATDCDDADCAASPACLPEGDCGDGRDDDRDGLTDCDDADCALDPECAPETDCGDGLDNDRDGLTDCDDPGCAGLPLCVPEFDCGNRLDDDADGRTDCDDPDCAGTSACVEGNCHDRFDNDGDGATDCDDPDCAGAPDCPPETICNDHIDNDYDTLVDCADSPECDSSPHCNPETDCTNDVDDDEDGATDCDDSDCADSPACHERVCGDGADNDGDGLTDCADPDCVGDDACPELVCDDGVDNDGDGAVDCWDTDCRPTSACEIPAGGDDCDGPIALPADPSGVFHGTTAGATDDGAGWCSFVAGNPEVYLSLPLTRDAQVTIDPTLSGHAGRLALADGYCGGEGSSSLACAEDWLAGPPIREFLRAGTYAIVVESSGSAGEPYVVAIETVLEEDCSNGIDDDADGLTDCAEFGCTWSAACLPLTGCLASDSAEPNDSVATAKPAADVAETDWLTLQPGAADYYALDVCPGARVEVEMLGQDVPEYSEIWSTSVWLESATGSALREAVGEWGSWTLDWVAGLTPTLYVVVTMASNWWDDGCLFYRLRFHVDRSACL